MYVATITKLHWKNVRKEKKKPVSFLSLCQHCVLDNIFVIHFELIEYRDHVLCIIPICRAWHGIESPWLIVNKCLLNIIYYVIQLLIFKKKSQLLFHPCTFWKNRVINKMSIRPICLMIPIVPEFHPGRSPFHS